MLITFPSFPAFPTPDIPKIPVSTAGITEGKSVSKSTVIVCVNNKCLTKSQESASGSSYLRVESVSKNGETNTSVESYVSQGKNLGNNVYSKIPEGVRKIIVKWFEVIKKYLTKI